MIYFNNAATSWPKPREVAEAVAQQLREAPASPGRGGGENDRLLEDCRRLLAEVLEVSDSSRIVLCASATQALNLAILGLDLRAGDRVLTSAWEHNSVLRPLFRLRDEIGVEVAIVEPGKEGGLDAAQFEKELDRGCKAVVLTHASNVTGQVIDVRPYFAAAKAGGAVTLLDASQSIGCLPVHPRELGADMAAFPGHKCLLGPTGTGALYVAPTVELKQIFTGGTGIRSDLNRHPVDMPMRLEAGTPNLAGLAGLKAALVWRRENGVEYLNRQRELEAALRRGLAEIPKVRIFEAPVETERTSAVSFSIIPWRIDELGYVLSESFGIACRSGLHCAPLIHARIGSAPEGTLRFSLSGFNSRSEVEQALDAVSRLAGED